MVQFLAGSLLEADFGNLRASRLQLKAPSKTIGNGRFWPNPGREPFGARFWQFAGFWKPPGSFWEASGKLPETAVPLCQSRGGQRTPRHKRFSRNPGREPFGAKFWQFGGFRAVIKTAFWDYWETARFGPNPGREPFGAKFW